MPNRFLDQGYPALEGMDTEQKIRVLADHVYQYEETLRYVLNNLAAENFNEAGLKEMGLTITEPITVLLNDVEGNIASLSAAAEEIKAQVTDGSGNYTVLTLKSDGLHIGNASGTTKINGGDITANSINLTQLSSSVTSQFGDANPAYIRSTYIDFRRVSSPAVYAGDFYGAQYHDLSGMSTLKLEADENTGEPSLVFAPDSFGDAFRIDYSNLGDSTSAYIELNGKLLAYVNSRFNYVQAGACWNFADEGLIVTYGTAAPATYYSNHSRTPKTGEVYLKI